MVTRRRLLRSTGSTCLMIQMLQAHLGSAAFGEAPVRELIQYQITEAMPDSALATMEDYEVLELIYVGDLKLGQTGLILKQLPLLTAVSSLNLAMQEVIFYNSKCLVQLGEKGQAQFWMTRVDQQILINWDGAQHQFDLLNLAGSIGHCALDLLDTARRRNPTTFAREKLFLADPVLSRAWMALRHQGTDS